MGARRGVAEEVPAAARLRVVAAVRAALALSDARAEGIAVAVVGRGAGRDVFRARVALEPGDEVGTVGDLAVLVPRGDALLDDAVARRTRREALLLQHLATVELGFRVPRFARAVDSEAGVVLVEEFLAGRPFEFGESGESGGGDDGRADAERAARVLGATLASLHDVDVRALEPGPWDFASRAHHARVALADVDAAFAASTVSTVSGRGPAALAPEAPRALAWMRARAFEERPGDTVLLHGDLRGRNLLVLEDGRPAVLDWEVAHLGHPAYDLAIVTGGAPAPFGPRSSLEGLLAEYGVGVTREAVRFFELALWLRTLARALGGDTRWGSVEEARARVGALLHAVGA